MTDSVLLNRSQDTLTSLLNRAQRRLESGRVDEGMTGLVLGLEALRNDSSPEEWRETATKCLAHPLRRLLHADPFTHRTFAKPRGYAGDAVMLDYIYGVEDGCPAPDGTCPLGRQVFRFTTAAGAPGAVRFRRRLLATLVDRIAERIDRPRILSLAAGHLREAGLSRAVAAGRVGEYIAADQDEQSLQEVERCYGRHGVRALPATVRQLLSGRVGLGEFDFVYSAGLYDYLNQNTARRLTRTMFEMLRPGGELLVANFAPGIRDVGYMEAFMAWELIYRDDEEVRDLGALIDSSQVAGKQVFADDEQNIWFLRVRRA